MISEKPCIVFCNCGSGVINNGTLVDLSSKLKQLDANVFELRDLCAMSLKGKEFLEDLGKKYEHKVIIACYPRAIKNMLHQGGINIGEFEVLNFKELSFDQILSKLSTDFHVEQGSANYQVKESGLEVPAWFPVIDESRCTHCGKCARFCLFGVYSFNNKTLKVVNPLACKNLCPACGRTCPGSAIMFPRLEEKSALAGAEPGIKIAPQEQGSLLMQLNNRNLNRKNIFNQEIIRQAENERNKALEELKLNPKNKN